MGTPAIDIAQEMWFAEVELLAWLAAAPDFGIAIAQLREVDIGSPDDSALFWSEDTWQIFLALCEIHKHNPSPDLRNERRMNLIERNLRLNDSWHPDKFIEVVEIGWGPGPVKTLLTRLNWTGASQSRAVTRLMNVHSRRKAMEAK
jgi:hypothetical protein